jgi:hypothetical protein
MHMQLPAHRAVLRALIVVTALGIVVAAARPGYGRSVPPSVTPVVAATAGALPPPLQRGAIVQVRAYPSSSTIEVVAWNPAEPNFGLRTWVRRGGAPDRYHRLWVAMDFNPAGGDVAKAQGLNRPLPISNATDTQNCVELTCSPGSTFGARIPDGSFRDNKENLSVKFITGSDVEINITVRRPLIDAYLAAVDSVIAAQKK